MYEELEKKRKESELRVRRNRNSEVSCPRLPAEVKTMMPPIIPSLRSVVRNTQTPAINFKPTSSVLNSESINRFDDLVETMEEMNKLNMGTTTSNDHNIQRVSLKPEYLWDKGRLVRVNKRLKFFSKNV